MFETPRNASVVYNRIVLMLKFFEAADWPILQRALARCGTNLISCRWCEASGIRQRASHLARASALSTWAAPLLAPHQAPQRWPPCSTRCRSYAPTDNSRRIYTQHKDRIDAATEGHVGTTQRRKLPTRSSTHVQGLVLRAKRAGRLVEAIEGACRCRY